MATLASNYDTGLPSPRVGAQTTVAVIDRRRTKARKYSYDAVKTLQKVWAVASGICGKYLADGRAWWWSCRRSGRWLARGPGNGPS